MRAHRSLLACASANKPDRHAVARRHVEPQMQHAVIGCILFDAADRKDHVTHGKLVQGQHFGAWIDTGHLARKAVFGKPQLTFARLGQRLGANEDGRVDRPETVVDVGDPPVTG